jgi:hypothetical protein
VVRGLSALLAAYAAALAYFLIAPALPALGSDRAQIMVAGALGLLVLVVCAAALAPAWDEPVVLGFVAVGSGLLALVLTAVDGGAAELLSKTLFATSLGMVFAWAVRYPEVVFGVVVFVAGLDIWSVLSGPASVLMREQPEALGGLSLSLPQFGGGTSVELGLSDIIYLGFLLAATWRYRQHREATAIAIYAALVAALGLAIAYDRALPALTAMSAAFLAVNFDWIAARLRRS